MKPKPSVTQVAYKDIMVHTIVTNRERGTSEIDTDNQTCSTSRARRAQLENQTRTYETKNKKKGDLIKGIKKFRTQRN